VLDGLTITDGNTMGDGGGICGNGTDATITNCVITNNHADGYGGGVSNCNGTITKCTISDNSANYGGGIYGGSLTIIDCIFIGNVSQSSGGAWDSPSNSRLINCLFSGNRTGGAGGAIFCPCTSIEMINCTVTGNVAEGEGFYRGGGICGDDDTDMFLTNCIFWGNRDFDGMIETSQIWQDYVSQTRVNHCCVQGWTGILGGSDNHGNNPRFVDPDGADNIAGTLDDNLRLQANSYCVNAGDNDAVPPSVLTDLDGNQRIFDGVVDQGAYENASTEPPQIAHWKLDESGGDIAEDSAWNHDGKLQGDLIWRPQCGRIAGALEFDGQGDYVNCGNDSNFNITGAITLAAWIKTESSSGKKTILAKHDDAWRIRIQNGNFEMVLPGLSSEQWFTVSGSAVNDNRWHHVLGVYDGHSIASVYIDGSLDDSREAAGSLNTNDEDVCIGRNSLLPERDFVGRIDDVQVYDYALTDDEIADLAHTPTIYHVDAAATGEKNGFCWSDAFVVLQSALAAAESGDQIWMAAGSYLPDYDLNTGSHTGDRHASFRLQNDIVIQGGYAGYGAADPYERDIKKYETILSGDLMGNDTPGLSPENLLTDSSRSDNSWTVILASGVNRSTVLDGCTVYGGQADIKYSDEGYGGGIYMEWGNPTLKNCTFHANAAADSGGGILNDCGLPLLINCCFEGNYCGWSGGGLCNNSGSPTLQGCRFENNYAGTGAGLYNLTSSVLTLDRCTFNSNVTTYRGGGIMIYEYGGQTILNNCLLTGNQAPEGGAIGCDAEDIGTLILNNCTIAENEAENTGGGIFSRYGGLAINNCIFWANADSTGYTETAQIHVPYPAPNYTCVQGWTGQWPGVGNIDADPCFVEPGYWDANGLWVEGDYHLLPDSPCIDAGDPDNMAGPDETDLDGNPRVIGGRIDMGACEFFGPLYYVDDDAPNDPGPGDPQVSDPLENGTAAHPFDTIQEGINVAIEGYTVLVRQGSYSEPGTSNCIDFLGKNITLTSEDPTDWDIIDNTVIRSYVQFSGTEDPNCKFTGFKIRNLEGAIYGNHTHATISHCNISGNGPCGATVIKDCDGIISNCLITDNTTFFYCGVYPVVFGCNGLIKNCTIANNESGLSVGTATIKNCIIYNNAGSQLDVGDSETLNISYCNLQGGLEGITGGGIVNRGPGNIDTDPRFVRAGYWEGDPLELIEGDYHLRSEGWRWNTEGKSWTYDYITSRCIDAGNPGSPLDNELMSVPRDPDNTWGVNLRINMGAYGGTGQAGMPPYDWSLPADLNNDGIVNYLDFAHQTQDWQATAPEQPGDQNRDGVVNKIDLAALAQNWLQVTVWVE
jgi:hypothetical protein